MHFLSIAALSVLNGIIYGMILFMICSGLTLIYSLMGVLSLAHSSFYMLGAYFAFQLANWFGFWVALLVAPPLVAAIGVAVEHWGLRYAHRVGHGAELLFTLGLALVIQELVPLFWGRLPVGYRVPQALDHTAFTLFSNGFSAYRLFALAVSLLTLLCVYLLFARTRIGLVVQAALANPEMAEMLGHNVPRVFTAVFGLGCGLAALAGVIAGNIYSTEPDMAQSLGAIAFAIIVIGGLGSLAGAFIASLVVGVLQTLGVAIDASLGDLLHLAGLSAQRGFADLASLKVSQLAPITPYILLLLTLIFKPNGLLGKERL